MVGYTVVLHFVQHNASFIPQYSTSFH